MNFVKPISYTSSDRESPGAVDRRLLNLIDEREADEDFWSLKDRDRRDSAHCIFQYPAMMVPLVQRRLLSSILEAKPSISSLYDPFVGSGTSLVSGMHFRLGVYGNDINPLAVLISRVRTARVTEFTIGAIVAQVVREAKADRSSKIGSALPNRAKWFQETVSVELSRLRRAIKRQSDLWVRRFLWVTLAETVRLTSNDRTSTYKLHARPADEVAKRSLSPIAIFHEIGKVNADSFADFRGELRSRAALKSGKYLADTDVRIGDTREISKDWGGASFDLIMTSPPYGDNLTTVPYGHTLTFPCIGLTIRTSIHPPIVRRFEPPTKSIDGALAARGMRRVGRKSRSSTARLRCGAAPMPCRRYPSMGARDCCGSTLTSQLAWHA